jgi:uncharacterized protein (TIGR02001 family)
MSSRTPLLLSVAAFCSFSCLADLSSTVTVTSNYLFNGITLTDHDPALQPSLDWSSGEGWYAGLWASNVKFSPGTELEFDGTVGYWQQLTPDWLLDVGVAQYTYHGRSSANSEVFNFPEAYLKLSYQNTKLGYWYASDYFGAGGGHYIVALFQTFELHENGTLLITADRSTSTQTDKFLRDTDGTYHHWRIAYSSSFSDLNWTLAFDDTDLALPVVGDAKVSLSVAKTFQW